RGPHPVGAPGSNRCHRHASVGAGARLPRTVPAHSAASLRSASPSSWDADSLDFFVESWASSRALSVFFGFALVSSLVLTVDAYVSTYSCPDRRMISYMISSVTDRSRKRSEGRPEYFEKSMGEPKTTPTRRSFGTSRPAGWSLSVPMMATGTTGASDSRTSRALPVRPRYSLPSGDRVPSG